MRRDRFLSPLLFASLAALTAGRAKADVYSRAELLERPPFGRVGPGAAGAGAGYELRGFFGNGDNLEVSIRKSGTSEARWVPVGGGDGPWRVGAASADDGTATLEADGMRFELTLEKEAVPGASGDGEFTTGLKLRPQLKAEVLRMNDEGARVRDEAMAKLRTDHPEYFTDPNSMSDEQRRMASNAINDLNRRLADVPAPAGH